MCHATNNICSTPYKSIIQKQNKDKWTYKSETFNQIKSNKNNQLHFKQVTSHPDPIDLKTIKKG